MKQRTPPKSSFYFDHLLLSMEPALTFSPFRLMVAIFLLQIASIILKYVPCVSQVSRTYIMKQYLIWSKIISASNEMIMMLLFLNLFIHCITYIKQTPQLRDKVNMIMVHDDFFFLFFHFACKIFFSLYDHEQNWSIFLFAWCLYGLGISITVTL